MFVMVLVGGMALLRNKISSICAASLNWSTDMESALKNECEVIWQVKYCFLLEICRH